MFGPSSSTSAYVCLANMGQVLCVYRINVNNSGACGDDRGIYISKSILRKETDINERGTDSRRI